MGSQKTPGEEQEGKQPRAWSLMDCWPLRAAGACETQDNAFILYVMQNSLVLANSGGLMFFVKNDKMEEKVHKIQAPYSLFMTTVMK